MAKIKGTKSDEVIVGSNSPDRILGHGGDDVIFGYDNDTIDPDGGGADDDDRIWGHKGDDEIYAGGGDDNINAGVGNDLIDGGNGDDDIDGGNGNDEISGGSGNDFMHGGRGADTFLLNPGDGFDWIDDFMIGEDALSLQGGLAVASASVVDVDGDGTDDTLLNFNSGDSVALLGVTPPSALRMVEPDDFPEGTVLNDAFPGVTLSNQTLRGDPDETDVLARDGLGLASTGSLVFGRESAPAPDSNLIVWSQFLPGLGGETELSAALRADFDVPTSFVSIDAIADDYDIFVLQAYDASDTLLDTFNTGEIIDETVTMSISRESSDISYVLAFGVDGEGGPLDNLQYDAGLETLVDPNDGAIA